VSVSAKLMETSIGKDIRLSSAMESSRSEADTGSAKLQGLKWLCRCVSGPPTPSSEYPHLDPILTGAIKAHRITSAWDEVVRLVASMSSRVVSPSLVVLRLGSYARQNRIHQALAEIGRIHKTVHILRTLDNEEYRRRIVRFQKLIWQKGESIRR
jgi:hypothetical protein